ncbi:MAG: L-histidine N(alpha)-methyltransferase [Alphaproteobacteria bacterium]
MNALVKLGKTYDTDRFTVDIQRWLSGDPSVNLAADMYINDKDDTRWAQGHSSDAYYVERDEHETFDLVARELNAKAQNVFDMGVGGKKAVLSKGLPIAKKVGAKYYYAFDLAPTLANDAAILAKSELGIDSASVVCDFFDRLPMGHPNTLIALLGLTLGNLETYSDSENVKSRLIEIFSNYASAVTSKGINTGQSHLLISYDANRNEREIRACYDNPEFEGLIRSYIQRAIDTSNFDYEVVVRPTKDVDFLSLGLRSKCDQIVHFNGREFAVEKGEFFPVINSSRFSIPFMTDAAVKAGWKPKNIWSATGRVQYQHFTIG